VIPEEVRERITGLLGDLPATFRWINSLDDVPRDPATRMVADGGAIFFLGEPLYSGGVWQVAAGLEVGDLVAGGRIYQLLQVDGDWQISGFTEEWLR
jgi:hypothetical protein